MGLHEEKKTCKIIDEIILYLLRKDCTTIDINLEYKERDKTTIIVKTNKLPKEVENKMLKYINQKRELEIEEYGWELMGESDVSNELELIGLLIDELTITEEAGKSVLKLTRKQ